MKIPTSMPAIVGDAVVWMYTTVRKYPPQLCQGFYDGKVICPLCEQPIAPNCDLIQHSTVDDPLMFTIFCCLACNHSLTYIYRLSQIPCRRSTGPELLEILGNPTGE